MVRIITRFLGPRLRAEHDSARGEAAELENGHGQRMAVPLTVWLRAVAVQRRIHRLLGLRYRIEQELKDDE